jgi:hypothetical protein
MDRTPTTIIIDHPSCAPHLLGEARHAFVLEDEPGGLRSRIERALRWWPSDRHAMSANERAICSRSAFGPVRLALVQQASQQAPAEIGGFRPLLQWALARVDWGQVIAFIEAAERRGSEVPGPTMPAAASPRPASREYRMAAYG